MPADATMSNPINEQVEAIEADAPEGRLVRVIDALRRRPWAVSGVILLLVHVPP